MKQTDWTYQPSSVVLDGDEYSAMVRVFAHSDTVWGIDLHKWELLIATQVVTRDTWGPEAIRWVRRVSRLSKEKLASLLSVPVQVIDEVERGVRKPSEDHKKLLVECTQISFDLEF